MLFLAILLAALSAAERAEFIARFKTPPVTVVSGLVSVYADCDAGQRREFQQPVADFAGNICRRLYTADNLREEHQEHPAIAIHVQDGRGPDTNVVTTVMTRDEHKFIRIRLPSPRYSDMDALRNAVVRGYYLTIHNKEISDDEAAVIFAELSPEVRAANRMAEVAAWRDAGHLKLGEDDESMLKEMRKVHIPGEITGPELQVFASRLNLYPESYRFPFAGKYHTLSFLEAIDVAKDDPAVRLAAANKVQELLLYGSGHGEEMSTLVKEYGLFLVELAKYEKPPEELKRILFATDLKMKGMVK